MKKAIVFLLALCMVTFADAQVKKKIKKGRRNKSESHFALQKNDFSAEWETGIENINPRLSAVVYPNLVLHYALSDRLEINTESTLLTTVASSPKKNTTGIEPVMIGANYQVLKDTDKSPSVILSAQLAIPFIATKEFTANHLAPTVQVDVQEAIHDKLQIGFTSGFLYDGFSTTPEFIYNARASYNFKKKWMLSTENFGFISQNLPQNSIDASFAYVKNDLVQFGITAGIGISSAAPKNYIALNGTWGINTSRKKHSP